VVHAVTLGFAGASLLLTSVAQAAPVVVRGFEAETMTNARTVPSASASAGAAVALRGRGLTQRVTLLASRKVRVTLKRGRSRSARVRLRIDGRRPFIITPRSRSWHTSTIKVSLGAGRHTIRLRSVRLPRGSSARAAPRVDRVAFLPVDPARRVLLGTALRSQNPAANPAFAITRDPRYAATFLKNFDSLTPENELKMEHIEPSPGRFTFAYADSLVAFATAHGKAVRGHALVITSSQLSRWLTKPRVPWTRNSLLAVMRRYITTVMNRYRGTIRTWDVVNEAFWDNGSYRQNIWYDVIGRDWIEQAFRIARAVDPRATLVYNDIASETSGAQQDAIYAMAKDFRNRGVPLDAIGLQNHTGLGGYADQLVLERTLARFASLGLGTEITEMDIVTQSGTGSEARKASDQAIGYRNAATACWDIAGCTSLTTWGVSDAVTWVGGDQAPLLFDADFRPKPAFNAVQAALQRTRP